MNRQRIVLLSTVGLVLGSTIPAHADQVFFDDVIVDGSLCTGQDCVNGESFGFDTIRLKENNLRIKFEDTSSTASFSTNDWQITINDSGDGGADYFAIDDIDGGRTPFKIEAGAPTDSLRIEDGGRIGFGTATPVVELHVADGDTPTLRLEQNGSSGFTAQTWDVGGNETNFFVRDATNGSKLPFKIKPAAPTNSLFVAADGKIGLGTQSPAAGVHLVVADTPSMRFDQSGSGFADQTWDLIANESNFAIRDANTPQTLPFRVRPGAPTNTLVLDQDGEIGMGTASPLGGLHVLGDIEYDVAEIARGQLLVENAHTSDTIMLNLVNDGAVVNVYRDDSVGAVWVETFGADDTDATGHSWSMGLSGHTTAMTVYGGGNVTIAGTLSQGSSRSTKHHIVPVASSDVLAKVAALEINRWAYRTDAAGVQHLGPMAEDFHAAFGLGHDARHLAAGDAAGVALASVKALHELVESQREQIDHLTERLERLEADPVHVEREGDDNASEHNARSQRLSAARGRADAGRRRARV